MQLLPQCPVCNEKITEPFITCKDYLVSMFEFQIVSCTSCGLKFTNPRPDESEIGKYYQSEEYISHSNTKSGLINSVYHFARYFTVRSKYRIVKKYINNSDNIFLMDYGCGTGVFLNYCDKKGWDVSGIEPYENARKYAISEYNLKVSSPDTLSQFSKYSFNAITLWHVLEHIHNLNETIIHLKSTLKKDGKLIIAVPNYESHDAKIYKSHWAAYDLPRHLYHFSFHTITKLMKRHGFELSGTHPMLLDAFYVAFLSEKYIALDKREKTRLGEHINAFINGLKSNMLSNNTGFSSQIYVFSLK